MIWRPKASQFQREDADNARILWGRGDEATLVFESMQTYLYCGEN